MRSPREWVYTEVTRDLRTNLQFREWRRSSPGKGERGAGGRGEQKADVSQVSWRKSFKEEAVINYQIKLLTGWVRFAEQWPLGLAMLLQSSVTLTRAAAVEYKGVHRGWAEGKWRPQVQAEQQHKAHTRQKSQDVHCQCGGILNTLLSVGICEDQLAGCLPD